MALRQDLRDAWRALRHAPMFSLAAVSALAVGIGTTAATFSVIDAVLVRPLPYADADRLVVVMHRRTNPVAPANFLDWQREADVFSSMGAAEYRAPNLGGNGEREKVYALRLTPEILPMLGVAPQIGRVLRPGEAGAREVVIGAGLWQRRFAKDPAVVGREVTLDGNTFTIVGVMPAAFRFAPFWATRAELWAPLPLASRVSSRGGNSLRVFARLAPDVSLDRARSRMAAITANLEQQFPGTNRQVAVTPVTEIVVGDVRRPLVVLFGAVALVLLLSCANVGHMLLARATSRVKEVAVRAALGASRVQLIRQFLVESLVLAAAGGLLGLALASQAISLIVALAGRSVPRIDTAVLDGRVVMFAALVSMASALLCGLMPALRGSRADLVADLRDVDRGATSGRGGRVWRQVLVASEMAIAVVILTAAGLLVRSFVALRAVDPGLDPEHVVSMVVSVTGSAEAAPGRRAAFYGALISRTGRLPGVAAASAINHLPLAGDLWSRSFAVEGRPVPSPGDEPFAVYRVVFPGYFNVMGMTVRRGRDVSEGDSQAAAGVVVVNETLARLHWPGEDAIGRRLRLQGTGEDRWQTVIGVVGDAVQGDWASSPDPEVYLPFEQSPTLRDQSGPQVSYITLVVRATSDTAPLVPAVRRLIQELAPDVTISEVLAMRDVVNEATSASRFVLVLLAGFAGVALVLAAIGVYGVMSYMVAERRQEIGIRLALGASPRQVLAALVRRGASIAVVGLVIGTVAAAVASRLMTGLVYGVKVTDPMTFTLVPLLLAVVALWSCYLPARRASRLDPLSEIRR